MDNKGKTWDFIKKSVDSLMNEEKFLNEASVNFEKKLLCMTLAKANGNVDRAAGLLKISSNELHGKLCRLGIKN